MNENLAPRLPSRSGKGEPDDLTSQPALPQERGSQRALTPSASPTSRWRSWRGLLDWARDRYPALPPARKDRAYRIAFWIVVAMALAFVLYFTLFLWAKQDAFQTNAEDLGIMDQALWNTLHGAPLHQTICNSVSDVNCLGDVSRLGIHFEPIMFPISLLYLVAPSPKTIQFFQAAVVALGAFPAFWIGARRLGSTLAGVVFAGVYLLYPALQAATVYDFHAVTLSAAFLMFALYFMLTRNDLGLFIACVLALSTKENIVADVGMIGLSVVLLQRRWRTGGALIALTVVWLAVELLIMRHFSPLGHSPTAGRYAYLGKGPVSAARTILTHPVQILQQHVFDPAGVHYLRVLFAPAAYLSLLSPLTLAIAIPSLGVNLLSSEPLMREGIYQYNANIVPVLVLAAIESVYWLRALGVWLARRARASARLAPARATAGRIAGGASASLRGMTRRWERSGGEARAGVAPGPPGTMSAARGVLLALLLLLSLMALYEQRKIGYTPLSTGYAWPQQTAHSRLASDFVALIPADASVSAQSNLVPHLSHRRDVYLYPYQATQARYVLLDTTGGDIYPYNGRPDEYKASVQQLLANPAYRVVKEEDGYILLERVGG